MDGFINLYQKDSSVVTQRVETLGNRGTWESGRLKH